MKPIYLLFIVIMLQAFSCKKNDPSSTQKYFYLNKYVGNYKFNISERYEHMSSTPISTPPYYREEIVAEYYEFQNVGTISRIGDNDSISVLWGNDSLHFNEQPFTICTVSEDGFIDYKSKNNYQSTMYQSFISKDSVLLNLKNSNYEIRIVGVRIK